MATDITAAIAALGEDPRHAIKIRRDSMQSPQMHAICDLALAALAQHDPERERPADGDKRATAMIDSFQAACANLYGSRNENEREMAMNVGEVRECADVLRRAILAATRPAADGRLRELRVWVAEFLETDKQRDGSVVDALGELGDHEARNAYNAACQNHRIAILAQFDRLLATPEPAAALEGGDGRALLRQLQKIMHKECGVRETHGDKRAWTDANRFMDDVIDRLLAAHPEPEQPKPAETETANPSEGDEVWRTAEARAADVKDNATRTALRAVIDMVAQRRALGGVR